MPHSEKDLLVASQIAYFDLGDDFEDRTLSDILAGRPEMRHNLMSKLNNEKDELKKISLQKSIDLYDEITNDSSKYGSWVIKSVKDDNKKSGFYGCLIETGENEAIVGFRGSEPFSDMHHLRTDWLEADLALLNSTLTRQQKEAEKFMKELSKSKFINKYNNISVTGHSLGGNLAMHATLTAPEPLQSKIKQCYNLDGPGVSNEYLSAHKDIIKKYGYKIAHIQWSPVGAILNPIPNSQYRSIKTNDRVNKSYNISKVIQKHDTCFVEFDGESFVRGEMDPISKFIGILSRLIDHHPGSWKLKLAREYYERVLVPYVIENDFINNTIDVICEKAKGIVREILEKAAFAKDVIDSFVFSMESAFRSFIKSFESFWASKSTQIYESIRVDTLRLREYAETIKQINRRLVRIDQKFDELYFKVGFEDFIKVLSADIQTSYSFKLLQCIRYLEDTASSFEKSERELIQKAQRA